MLTLRLSPQTTVFLYGLGTQGKSLSESLGVVQTLSNIEAPASWRLYEAFVEYLAAAKRLSVLAGLYDLSSEFDVLSTAGLLLEVIRKRFSRRS
jgi:porin